MANGKGQCYKVVTSASLLTISKLVVKTYSQQPKTRPSKIQMVIFRTKFWSCFQMVAILFLPFENRIELFSSASLGHFGIKNILFMTLFFIKRSRLATI
jgi:hypothetical protein